MYFFEIKRLIITCGLCVLLPTFEVNFFYKKLLLIRLLYFNFICEK